MRCLWLAGEHPYPADSGLFVYSAGIAESLARSGVEVVGLGLSRPGAHERRVTGGVEWRVINDRRRSRFVSALSGLPAMAYSLSTKAYIATMNSVLDERRWDAVVIDHLQMGWAARRIQTARIVYVSHNHEESVRRAVASRARRSLVDSVVLPLDSAKVTRLERSLLSRCHLVTAVSEEDAELFARQRPELARLILPPGYDGDMVERRCIAADVPRRAVVLGNLLWHVKQRNLKAFLDAADPLFHRAGAEIVVVGPAPEDFVRRTVRTTRATAFAGRVHSLAEWLAGARLGIVSEPLGGGFKLKALDYIFHRVPMAVLAGSVAGLPLTAGEDYVSASTEESLARAALHAMDDLELLNRLQERAYSACASRYAWSSRGEALRDALAALP